MVDDSIFTRGTVNERYSAGDALSRVQLLSAGFQPNDEPRPETLTDPNSYNGGICWKRISRVQTGDLLFRFSKSTVNTIEGKFSGAWWFDKECFDTIRHTSRMENSDFVSTARTLLGILEWSDMKNLVGGIVTAEFWCLKGLTGAYTGKSQRFSGPPRTDIIQIYVPGGLSLRYFRQCRDDILTSGIV